MRYYELLLRKNESLKEYRKLDSLIESKELILKENINSMKIIEDVDIEKFKNKYKIILDMYENIIDTEHELKKQHNTMVYEKNFLLNQYNRISTTIDTIIPEELEEHCPNCKQIIYKHLDENYDLLLSKENLINEREKIQLELKDIEPKLEDLNKEIMNINTRGSSFEKKLNADGNVISLADRAESYAFSQINTNLRDEIKSLTIERDDKYKEYKEVESSLNNMNREKITTKYRELMIKAYTELNISFAYKNYYTSNLESVNINLSGASKVQAFIAQYMSIFELTQLNSESVNIPIFIDTYLKDDFNQDELNRTTDYVFNKIDKSHQAFLYISNNRDTLSRIESYNYTFNKIVLDNKEQLFTKDYMSTYSKYEDILQ